MIERGIHYGLGMDAYHAWKLDKANLKQGPISCSIAKQFAENPYAWLRSEDKKPTTSMQTGSLLDLALTEPDKFDSQVVTSPFDSYRTKEARTWRDEALADGMIIASDAEQENAKACAAAVWSHSVAAPILEQSQFQTGVVTDIGGIPFKCLIDILPCEDAWEEIIWDYKTTSMGLHDEGIKKAIGQWGYYKQAALYRSAWNKESKDRHCEKFGFIFQDPMTREVRVVVLDDDSMDLGTRWAGNALKDYAKAAHQGIKSRYAETRSTVGVPVYIAMQEEDAMIAQEVAE